MAVEVFVDGASRGQGRKHDPSHYDEVVEADGSKSRIYHGEAACAVVIYSNKKKIVEYARGLGRRTNNEAEYEAVLTALLICSMADLPDPIIYSDSLVVVNQINGDWECHTERLLPLLKSIQIIRDDGAFRFRIQQVPRDYVHEADQLAKEFLDRLEEEMAKVKPRRRRKKKRKKTNQNKG